MSSGGGGSGWVHFWSHESFVSYDWPWHLRGGQIGHQDCDVLRAELRRIAPSCAGAHPEVALPPGWHVEHCGALFTIWHW